MGSRRHVPSELTPLSTPKGRDVSYTCQLPGNRSPRCVTAPVPGCFLGYTHTRAHTHTRKDMHTRAQALTLTHVQRQVQGSHTHMHTCKCLLGKQGCCLSEMWAPNSPVWAAGLLCTGQAVPRGQDKPHTPSPQVAGGWAPRGSETSTTWRLLTPHTPKADRQGHPRSPAGTLHPLPPDTADMGTRISLGSLVTSSSKQ